MTSIVRLGELLTRSNDPAHINSETTYKEVTVKLWGKGVVLRREVLGVELLATRRLQVQAGQFILSRIDARHGAFGIIPPVLDGAVVTPDFPVYNVNELRVLPGYLSWLSRTASFIAICRAASEGSTNRVRLDEAKFLDARIELPPVEHQRQIVGKIDAIVAKLSEATVLRQEVEFQTQDLLLSVYREICQGAPRQPMGEVAPLVRRPVVIQAEGLYPEIGARSFGRGSFRKPDLLGSELTWQKLFQVKAGDVLFSNIKAWEGAIAVVTEEDDNRYVSHRYLTCVPVEGLATASFLHFYLLSPEGLAQVQSASPGSADRNRTLGQAALKQIKVPVPTYEKQVWFDSLISKCNAAAALRKESERENDALMPSVLDKAFKGELLDCRPSMVSLV